MERTGTSMRVVDFKAQDWSYAELHFHRDEASLLCNYSGKVGKVVRVDDLSMPYILRFSEGAGVPIREMRFHESEVDAG